MGISKDGGGGSVLAENVEDFVRITTFLRTRIEFAVRIGTCPTLAKTVVTLRIHLLRLRDVGQVLLAFMNILSSLKNNGSQPQFDESQGCKQPSWACPHDNHLRTSFDIRILRPLIFIVVRLLIDIYAYL